MKMMIKLISIILLTCCQNVNNKNTQNTWEWNALLYINQVQIPIYKDSSKSEVKYYVLNDTIKEEFHLIQIIRKSGNLVEVKTASGIDENIISEGWIDLKYLGIYPNSHNVEGSVRLFSTPNEETNFIEIVTNEMLKIIDIKNEWYFVETTQNGRKMLGWLSKKEQCANPYSTCN